MAKVIKNLNHLIKINLNICCCVNIVFTKFPRRACFTNRFQKSRSVRVFDPECHVSFSNSSVNFIFLL